MLNIAKLYVAQHTESQYLLQCHSGPSSSPLLCAMQIAGAWDTWDERKYHMLRFVQALEEPSHWN